MITIVTSCYRYGRYLGEWTDHLLRSSPGPAAVGIFTHGTEEDQAAGRAAKSRLQQAGLAASHQHEPELLDFGIARNRAVALAETEWVMHLDADDLLMPQALKEWAELAPHADVVAMGYERTGDLASGPRLPRKLYKSSTGREALDISTPASGCSPFRKAFWQRAPYRTDLIGGWDTALWLGFAHLGARFRATRQPGFWYRQHADSLFNTRRLSGWPAARAGQQLESLRRGDRGVSVLVPWAPDYTGQRERVWSWLRQRLERHHPEWQICEGQTSPQQWRKGTAVDRAFKASQGGTLVVLDADCVVPREALLEAVRLVQAGEAPWAMPHRNIHRLNASATERWLRADPATEQPAPRTELDREVYEGFEGGGIFVLPRWAYLATGGIPALFVGWGAEDEAYATILSTLIGRPHRQDHPLVHLWHPPQERSGRDPNVRANRLAYRVFHEAQGNPDAMWALVQGGRQAHLGRTFSLPFRHQNLVRGRDQLARAAGERKGGGPPVDDFAKRRLSGITVDRRPGQPGASLPVPERKGPVARPWNREAAMAKAAAAQAAAEPVPAAEPPTSGTNVLEPVPLLERHDGPAPGVIPIEPDPLEGVSFASLPAKALANRQGLALSDFTEANLTPGERGYTIEQVRAALEAAMARKRAASGPATD